MFLGIIETVTNYVTTLSEDDVESALKKHKPALVQAFTDNGCSSEFAEPVVGAVITSILSDNKTAPAERLKKLVEKIVLYKIDFSRYEVSILLQDLDADLILQKLDTEWPDTKIVIVAEILSNTALEISLSTLETLLSVTDMESIIIAMEDPNQFMQNLHNNNNLTPEDKDRLVFNPYFGQVDTSEKAQSTLPSSELTKAINPVKQNPPTAPGNFVCPTIIEEDEDYATGGEQSPSANQLSGQGGPVTEDM